jgi:hypothetical protein
MDFQPLLRPGAKFYFIDLEQKSPAVAVLCSRRTFWHRENREFHIVKFRCASVRAARQAIKSLSKREFVVSSGASGKRRRTFGRDRGVTQKVEP